MSVSAKGKQQKLVSIATVSGTVYCEYPILPFGIVTGTFFPTTFSKELYTNKCNVHARLPL